MKDLFRLMHRHGECIEFLNSPKYDTVLKLIRDPLRSAEILVDQGTTTDEERAFLSEIIRESAAEEGPIIEIGLLFGFTTTEMALIKDPDRPLVAVDSFTWNPWGLSPSEHRKLADRVLRVPREHLNVRVIASDKESYYKRYDDGPPCMVFLDAIHTYEETKNDIDWALRVGCHYIAGHDYSNDFPGVIQAVNDYGQPEVRGTVWLLRT
jgi:predicted O-methyltransferase YrrM